MVADIDEHHASTTASSVGASSTLDWRQIIDHSGIDAVVVCTPNKHASPIGVAALEAGKHVLCEKPLGRNSTEAERLVATARAAGLTLKTGFNHRHHPAISKAHTLCTNGDLGPLLTVRAAYGHGGRPGYDTEWRADPDLAGGGELLDQGVHLIDLARWFLGDFVAATGVTATWFWDVHPLEDNCFALLRTGDGKVANIHSSWTQWKNLFRFEVFGRDGFILVEGLGGSYGAERLTFGRRLPTSGPPVIQDFLFEGEDVSWALEWQEFTHAIAEHRPPLGDGCDGLAASDVVEAIYASSRDGTTHDVLDRNA
jgi:predicted dehydrogenase